MKTMSFRFLFERHEVGRYYVGDCWHYDWHYDWALGMCWRYSCAYFPVFCHYYERVG